MATTKKTTKKQVKAPLPGEENQVLVTAAGLEKLINELEQLKTTGRKEISARLAEAISYGDLSENSEYDEAKNQQAFVEGRILELEDQIKNAKVIEESKSQKGVVSIGSTVVLEFEGEQTEYSIVGSTEADPMGHKISNESPVGASILGQKANSTVEVNAPGGILEYKVISVK